MRVVLAFVMWIFAQMGKGLQEQHRHFVRGLKHETGLHIFVWCFVSLISSLVVFCILMGFQSLTGISVPVELWFTYVIGCVVYLVYTGFSLMYTAFKAERRELFETIKNGK